MKANTVCIFGVGDLHHLLKLQQFTAHKFDTEEMEPIAFDCLELWMIRKIFGNPST